MRLFKRIRCWFRGHHRSQPFHPYGYFRYDVSGMCCDCGKVGTGVFVADGE